MNDFDEWKKKRLLEADEEYFKSALRDDERFIAEAFYAGKDTYKKEINELMTKVKNQERQRCIAELGDERKEILRLGTQDAVDVLDLLIGKLTEGT